MDLCKDTFENHITQCAPEHVGPQCCPLAWFGIVYCKTQSTERNVVICDEKSTHLLTAAVIYGNIITVQ